MYINRENILSYFLTFVVIWFGVNEVMSPEKWIGYVPKFASQIAEAKYLVTAHGVVLILSGLALVFNFYRRVAAVLLFILIGDIVYTLISVSGLDEIAVRDIGLMGVALALALRN